MTSDIALQLLKQAKLTPEEVSSRVEQALDPDYWKALGPDLSIEGAWRAEAVETAPADNFACDAEARSVAGQGYFQFAPIYGDAVTARMRQGVEALRDAGWPPVFAFVYDQFWSLLRSPSMTRFLTAVLGPGYRQTAQIWLHYVNPHSGMAGWGPHFDAPERAHRLTVWVALSDATLDNGCMYVVQRSAVPPETMGAFARDSPLSAGEVKSLLQASRALPARTGSVIGWDSDVMHWGSLYTGGGPRISFSQVFMGATETPVGDEAPPFAGDALPDFSERLEVIAKAIKTYCRFEPMLVRYRDLAERLLEPAKTTHPCISA